MSRVIQARVTDGQYEWLIERADEEEGDMSAAIRGVIDMARVLNDVLHTADPPEALRELLKRSAEETWDEGELES